MVYLIKPRLMMIIITIKETMKLSKE